METDWLPPAAVALHRGKQYLRHSFDAGAHVIFQVPRHGAARIFCRCLALCPLVAVACGTSPLPAWTFSDAVSNPGHAQAR